MRIPFFSKKEEPAVKANPPRVMFADESTRGTINKTVMPNFIFNPPFGAPRFKNPLELRRLGNTSQARMAKQTLIDELVSIPWSILPREETDEVGTALQNKIDEVENFFMNPNTNNESFEYLLRGMLEDLFDFDSGVWVKEFDKRQRMVELRFADAASFLKNPDIFGKFGKREDIIPFGVIDVDNGMMQNLNRGINSATATAVATGFTKQEGITVAQAQKDGAYFQFGFSSNVRPIAFGRKEIVWFEKNPQTNQIYGKSPTESIMDVLQTLKYSIEYNLEYFEDNNVPKGFINMPGSDEDEMDAFRDKWNELQIKVNNDGLLKKNFHRVPITNSENAKFERVQFSSAELELIETQKWFSKLVWASYGVTPSELGFTEDSNLATEISQSRIIRRKTILPILRVIEYFINNNILTEWDFNDEIKFEFNTFDVEDEKSKWELYGSQIQMGAKTVNEIRKLEGLEEIEEPEEVPMNEVRPEDLEDGADRKPKDPKPDDSKKRAEKKADEVGFDDIVTRVLQITKKDKELFLQELKRNTTSRLTLIKDFSTLMASIKSLFNLDNLKTMVDKATLSLFSEGVEKAEAEVKAQGVIVNAVAVDSAQVKFLSDLAFEHLKDLSTEMQGKLRKSLKMGFSNGEGLGSLTDRVQTVFEATKDRARMIARTESSRISTQGTIHAAAQIQSDGIKLKKWLLWTNDDRTSELTKALHRKYGSPSQAIPLSENFKIVFGKKNIDQAGPPFHPNERDELITLIVDNGENNG